MQTPEELVVLLDDNGKEIGTAPKLPTHHAHTPLHKAFSCYVFDAHGRFLATQRALSKKVWPGVWTNSVCGHPAPSESDHAAIARRSQQELGMEVTDIQILLPNYRYKTPPYNGIIENEICPVYVARLVSGPQPNPEEIEAYEWLSWDDYTQAIQQNPDKYSYWTKDQVPRIVDHPLLKQYARAT